jgi:ABC-2 type transport system ATP-binding protein
VYKLGWGSAVYAAGLVGGAVAPEVHRAFAESAATNGWSLETYTWFGDRSPSRYLRKIRTPTLLAQGVNDTLFPLNEAITSFFGIMANGVPAKLLVYCGGHVSFTGTSCTGGRDQTPQLTKRWLAWLARYVKGDTSVSTGAAIDFQLQDGSWHGIPSLPARKVVAAGRGTLVHKVAPTSGGVTSAGPAFDGVRIGVRGLRPEDLTFGLPRARLVVTGTGSEADVFVKLLDVDVVTGEAVVVDDQVQARRFHGLSDNPQATSYHLAGVAWRVRRGHQLVVEVTSSSNDYAASRVPSLVHFDLRVEVPVV